MAMRKRVSAARKCRLPALALLIALPGFGGCAAPMHTDYTSFIREPRPVVSSREYRMAPPDVVAIASKRVKELNGISQAIRSDGRITVPLLGNVFVAGRTPEEVSADMEAMAREYYQDADVTLTVTGYNSKKIYVFGEVAARGPLAYNGSNTILGTLAVCQPTRLADPARVQILRPSTDGNEIRRMTVDLNAMVQNGDRRLDAVLEEGDIVFVPPNQLAKVGLAMQQLMLPLQPISQVVQAPVDIAESFSGTPYGGDSGN